nr:hypothetical protein [Tanacetum cinerariifolium]
MGLVLQNSILQGLVDDFPPSQWVGEMIHIRRNGCHIRFEYRPIAFGQVIGMAPIQGDQD